MKVSPDLLEMVNCYKRAKGEKPRVKEQVCKCALQQGSCLLVNWQGKPCVHVCTLSGLVLQFVIFLHLMSCGVTIRILGKKVLFLLI